MLHTNNHKCICTYHTGSRGHCNAARETYYRECRRRHLSSPLLELPLLLEPLNLAASCFFVALSDLSILPTATLYKSGCQRRDSCSEPSRAIGYATQAQQDVQGRFSIKILKYPVNTVDARHRHITSG